MHCISVVSGSERYLSLWKTSSSWLINSISVIASTDGFFVSRYVGADALSAINIVYPLIGLAVGIGIMLGTGGSAVIARQLGIGEGRFVCNGGKTQSGAGADDSFRPGQHGTGLCLYRGFRLGDCGRGMDDCGWIFHSSCFRTFLFLETKNGDNEYFYFFAVYGTVKWKGFCHDFHDQDLWIYGSGNSAVFLDLADERTVAGGSGRGMRNAGPGTVSGEKIQKSL